MSNCDCSSRDLRVPGGFLPEDGVQYRQHLAHARCDRDLPGFTSSYQPLVERMHRRIMPNRREHGHVERRPHDRPASPAEALPFALPAVAGERSHAGQHRNRCSADTPQFGKRSNQHGGQGCTDTRDGHQPLPARAGRHPPRSLGATPAQRQQAPV